MPPGIVPYDICLLIDQKYTVLIPKAAKVGRWYCSDPLLLDCLGGVEFDVYQGAEDHVIGTLSFPEMRTRGKEIYIEACLESDNKLLIQVQCGDEKRKGIVSIF